MTKLHNLYIGRSGQLAVMAEFLARGYNVAIPEVDRGDDIFVVKDSNGQLSRIQVKTATAGTRSRLDRVRFFVTRKQLEKPVDPDLTFVLAVRKNGRWDDFIVISRAALSEQHLNFGAGSSTRSGVIFALAIGPGKVTCSGQDWTNFRNNWSPWPVIVH